jgi:hypothetical protein
MIEFDIAFRPGDDFAVTFGGEVPLEAEMGQVMEVLATEERTVELSMPYGNQVILPTSGKVMRKVTIQKPDTLLSENIKKDVVIGGVTGTLEDGGSFKAVIERTAVSPTLPGDLTTIGYSAFSGCPNLALTSLPSGVTSISDYAFNGCRNLAITRLPPGITNIGFGVFANCTGLTSITFEGNPKTIHSSAFNGCSNLTTIYVPWSQGQVANAPWGASKATIIYDYTEN